MIVKIAQKIAEMDKRISGDNLKDVGHSLKALVQDRMKELTDDDLRGASNKARNFLADIPDSQLKNPDD